MSIPIVEEKDIKKQEKEKAIGNSGSKVRGGRIKIIPVDTVVEYPSRKKRPLGPVPVIPTTDDCCASVCTILNSNISRLEKILELRAEELGIAEIDIVAGAKIEPIVVYPPGLRAELLDRQPEVIVREVRTPPAIATRTARKKIRRQIGTVTNQLTSLKDLRFNLREKGSCKCIEDISRPVITIPKK